MGAPRGGLGLRTARVRLGRGWLLWAAAGAGATLQAAGAPPLAAVGVAAALVALYIGSAMTPNEVVRALMRTAVSLYFRECACLGQENVPRDGPLVVIGAPHGNQFLDPMVLSQNMGREVSFLTAAKTLRRKDVGKLFAATNTIAVERPQDLKRPGVGRVVAEGGGSARVSGRGTAFLKEGVGPGWKLLLKNSAGETSPPLAVASVAGEAELELKEAPPPAWAGEACSFAELPHVDQASMFRHVFECLKEGGAVGLFPEGGSHDRSELLPLKPGFCLMALGAMAENPGLRVRVLPVGITYFNRHKLNSRCLVQYGRPVEVRQELVTRFQEGGAGKRAAVDELMLEARDALGRVVTTGGTWDELRDFWMLRDLYVPSGMLLAMSTAEQVSLSQAFALDHSRVRQSDPLRVERLMRRVRNYSRKLRANWLTDRLSVMNAYILARAGEDGGRSSPGRLLLLLGGQLLGLAGISLLWLPVDLSLAPMYVCMALFARRMSKKALEKSTVKIKAKDTVGTYKLIIGIPLYLGLHAAYTAGVHIAFGRTASVGFLFFMPLLQHIAYKAQAAEWERWAGLRTLLGTVLRPGVRDELARERARLKAEVRQVVDDLDWGQGQRLSSMPQDTDLYASLQNPFRRSKSIFLTSVHSERSDFTENPSLGLISHLSDDEDSPK